MFLVVSVITNLYDHFTHRSDFQTIELSNFMSKFALTSGGVSLCQTNGGIMHVSVPDVCSSLGLLINSKHPRRIQGNKKL